MEHHHTSQEFLMLREYNLIVKEFILAINNQQMDIKVLESVFDQRVQNVKESFPDLFALKESEILFSDDLLDFNPFRTLLYWAINSHWDSIKLASPAIFLQENYCKIFFENLKFFNSEEFFDIIANNSLSEESRSLSRTAALYFYIRAPYSSFVYFTSLFKSIPKMNPTRISISMDKCIETFNSLKLSHIVCSAFIELFPDISIDELFEHVCNNSFYTYFPFTLFGLTTIGDYVFINNQFNHEDNNCQAATLVNLLHESANLARRFKKGQSAYFELIQEKNELKDLIFDSEMSSIFEQRIFGERLEFLNENSASFLMKGENWDLSIDDFQNKLREEFEKGEKEELTKIRIGKHNEIIPGIDLGRCGMTVKFEPKHLIGGFNRHVN